ncbi:MAG: hypothetical protein A49_04760 [Methyloceanibacter sp.]|nr:MAG: hypothetical protein A49_04760 [Methyloceanibacter sp.]
MQSAKDLTGKRFGILKVVSREGSKKLGARSTPLWLCRCACGTKKLITTNALRNGQRSCGCLPPRRPSKGVYYHKPSKLWRAMLRVNGKRLEIGYFKTEAEATAALSEALK